MNKIQQAGETGRSAGYGFEDLILNEINCNLNGKIAQQIVTTIAKDKKIDLNNFNICAEKMPSKVIDRFDNSKKTSPKADIRINFKNQNEHFRFGISIKSSNISIQVQITNIDNFKIACENKKLVFSDLLYISLSKFCGFGKYKPTKEEQKSLKQGDRNRWLIQELEEFFADYYLVNNSKFSATGKVDFCIKNIDEVIQNSIQKSSYKVTDKGSFHIGSITVQMKGSGKGEAYHGFQFNKSGC